VWPLWRRGAQRRRELAAFTKSDCVTSLDAEREVSPRPQANRCRRATCVHPRSFSEPVLLVKSCVVVDDILRDWSITVISRCPHYHGLQCATLCQPNVIWRVWSTCMQTICQCQHYFTFINSPNEFSGHLMHMYKSHVEEHFKQPP